MEIWLRALLAWVPDRSGCSVPDVCLLSIKGKLLVVVGNQTPITNWLSYPQTEGPLHSGLVRLLSRLIRYGAGPPSCTAALVKLLTVTSAASALPSVRPRCRHSTRTSNAQDFCKYLLRWSQSFMFGTFRYVYWFSGGKSSFRMLQFVLLLQFSSFYLHILSIKFRDSVCKRHF